MTAARGASSEESGDDMSEGTGGSHPSIYWDDLDIGDALPTREVFLSKDQVRAYAQAAGMMAARFTDDEGARREGLPGMIAPGNMTMGLLSQLATDWSVGFTLRRLGVTFRGLVRPDQLLRLHASIIGKQAADGAHTVELDVWLEAADGERPVTGTATVVLPVRDA
jgi:acyl dehydratase